MSIDVDVLCSACLECSNFKLKTDTKLVEIAPGSHWYIETTDASCEYVNICRSAKEVLEMDRAKNEACPELQLNSYITLYDRFIELVNARGITVYRVAKDVGLPTSLFSNWKHGRYTPKIDKIKRIADYFNVSVEEFIKRSA